MSWQRKYDFKSGTKISSSQVDEEFDQLIGAVNQIQSDDNTKDADVRALAQMMKITKDTGGTKLSITDTTKNILTELLNAGNGMHTFYSASGVQGNPTASVSIRGVFHQTGTGNGWVYAQDTNGDSYENFVVSGTWKGWKGTAQTVLYTAPPPNNGIYLIGAQTVIPTKKLSETNMGWCLVWSDYDPGVGANDYDWHYTYIPKYVAKVSNGTNHIWTVPKTPSSVIVKHGLVYDDKIVGHDDNSLNGGDDVCLRYVLEW